MHIADKVFIITGAASGLGAATAEHLLALGARVVIADSDVQAGEREAQKLGEQAAFIRTDVAQEEDAIEAVSFAVQRFGRLSGLINCAGIAPAEKIIGRDGPHRLESFARALQVNLLGSFNMLRIASAEIARQTPIDGERGVIINTASVAAFDGQLGQAAYAASKGGVVAMTLPAARELAKHLIRVMTIAPGIMATPMLMNMSDTVRDALGAMVPHPARLGQPAEFAALVAHIIENTYLNGEVIRLDGGIRMAAK